MKKILCFLFIAFMIVFSSCALPDTGEETDKEFEKQTGVIDEGNDNEDDIGGEGAIKLVESFEHINGYEDVFVEKGYLHPCSPWNYVDVYLEFDRIVERGSEIRIKITTVCISDSVLEWKTSSTYLGRGVLPKRIENSADSKCYMEYDMTTTADSVKDSLQPGGTVEEEHLSKTDHYIAGVEVFNDYLSLGFFKRDFYDNAPAGVYDLHLWNGYVYKNAFIIIEKLFF